MLFRKIFCQISNSSYICIAVPVVPLPDLSAGDESGFFLFTKILIFPQYSTFHRFSNFLLRFIFWGSSCKKPTRTHSPVVHRGRYWCQHLVSTDKFPQSIFLISMSATPFTSKARDSVLKGFISTSAAPFTARDSRSGVQMCTSTSFQFLKFFSFEDIVRTPPAQVTSILPISLSGACNDTELSPWEISNSAGTLQTIMLKCSTIGSY